MELKTIVFGGFMLWTAGMSVMIYHDVIRARNETKTAIVKYLSIEEEKARQKASDFRTYIWEHYTNKKDQKYFNLVDSAKSYDSLTEKYNFAKTQVNNTNIDDLLAEQ
jgi:hypothetical protein